MTHRKTYEPRWSCLDRLTLEQKATIVLAAAVLLGVAAIAMTVWW